VTGGAWLRGELPLFSPIPFSNSNPIDEHEMQCTTNGAAGNALYTTIKHLPGSYNPNWLVL